MVTIIGQFNPWGSLKTGTTPTFSHMEQVESSWQEQIELGVIEVCRVMFCDTTKQSVNCSSSACCHIGNSGYSGRYT
jgi:hypothetical protein